jgi:hypothetical protein
VVLPPRILRFEAAVSHQRPASVSTVNVPSDKPSI